MKVHELVADAFVAEGTDTVFALMGDANMTWIDGLVDRPGVRVVHARHEGATVAMADGWAQSTGRVGVCSTTCGPGLANTVTSLRVAAHHRTPVVLLAGDTPQSSVTHLQAFDVGTLASLAGVRVMSIASPETAAARVRAAFATARRDLCPVVLTLPFDLAELPVPDTFATYVPAPLRASVGAAPAEQVRDVADRLAAADHVTLLLGRGAVAADALDLADALADHLDAVTGTTVKALGALQHRARSIGVVGGFTPRDLRPQIAASDVVLALGASLSWFTTLDGALIDPMRTIQVTDRADAWDPAYVFEPDLHVVADCRDFLAQLLDVLRPDGSVPPQRPGRPEPTALPTGLPSGTLADDGLDPVAVLATVRRALPSTAQVVTGAGHFWNLIVEMEEPFHPELLQMHYGFGAIAQGMPAGIGAALARPDVPTVVIEGDGSVMMTLQELETAARSRVPVLVLVVDDGAYGAELHKLAAQGLHPQESVHGFVDLAGVARSLGGHGSTPASLRELDEAVHGFLREPTFTLLDVRVTRTVVSARHRANYAAMAASDTTRRPAAPAHHDRIPGATS